MRSPVRNAATLLALFAVCALPVALAGQAPLGSGVEARARTHLELGARYTSIRAEGAVLLGGAIRFDLGGPVTFGGGGWLLTEPVELASGEPGTGLRLRMAYAGLVTAVDLVETPRVRGALEMLWGAGNAKLELPAVRTEIAADNFLVLEPGVSARIRLAGPLHLRGDVAYRWAVGVEDLPGVSGDQLRGASASLGLSVGPF